MSQDSVEIVLDGGSIVSMVVAPDPRWSVADAVERLRAVALAYETSISFVHDVAKHVTVTVTIVSDPLLLLHAFDLVAKLPEPFELDDEVDLQALIASVSEREGGQAIIEVAEAAAEVRAAVAQQRYDEAVQRLGVANAPEPRTKNPEDYRFYMNHSAARLCRPYMQYMERQLAAGVPKQEAYDSVHRLIDLPEVDLAIVQAAVGDTWAYEG